VNRPQLEHVIRAAAAITGDREIIVVGSTAILAQFPDAPLDMVQSREADVYPSNHPERFEMLDVIGELSPFHATFGYYADGVPAELPQLPAGWRDRVVSISVGGAEGPVVGLCLEVHDLVLSKYVAFREKDQQFVRAAAEHQLVKRDVLLSRLEEMALDTPTRTLIRERIDADFVRDGSQA
jgi:hypothetical protein